MREGKTGVRPGGAYGRSAQNRIDELKRGDCWQQQSPCFDGNIESIFADVQTQGPKLITEEGYPSCVILSHTEYERIMEELADAAVTRMAEERLAKLRAAEDWITQEEIDKEFGFTEEKLKGWEEVEIG